MEPKYIYILSIIGAIIVARYAFQKYRRSNRRCTHCFSTNIERWHERELYMNRGIDEDGFYRVDCTTYQRCHEAICLDSGRRIPVKAYIKVVRARWYSIRHWRYKFLLANAPGTHTVHKIVF